MTVSWWTRDGPPRGRPDLSYDDSDGAAQHVRPMHEWCRAQHERRRRRTNSYRGVGVSVRRGLSDTQALEQSRHAGARDRQALIVAAAQLERDLAVVAHDLLGEIEIGQVAAMDAQERAGVQAALQVTDGQVAETRPLRRVNPGVVAFRAHEAYRGRIDQHDAIARHGGNLHQLPLGVGARRAGLVTAHGFGDVVEHKRISGGVTQQIRHLADLGQQHALGNIDDHRHQRRVARLRVL